MVLTISSIYSMKKDKKYYNWEYVVWTENLESIQQLIDFGVRGFISPLHVSDNEQPHYHWITMFPRQQSYDSVIGMLDDAGLLNTEERKGCINTALPVKDVAVRARYLVHADEDPNVKPHLDPEMVTCVGGIDYMKYFNDVGESFDSDRGIFQIIQKYNCTSYAQLVNYCAYVSPSYYKSVSGRCGFWSAYMRSLANDHVSITMQYEIDEKRMIKNEDEMYRKIPF